MINLSSPEVANARKEYTSFRPGELRGSMSRGNCAASIVPVHVVKEWQWPGDRAKDQTPLWRTVRISEWRWPMRDTYLCDLGPSPHDDNDGWPPQREAESPDALVKSGLLSPWNWFPACEDEPCLEMDDAGYRVAAKGYSGLNDGLPDDYLEFWTSPEAQWLENYGGSYDVAG